MHLCPECGKHYMSKKICMRKMYPLNKSSSIYASYPVDKYLSSGYSFEQLGPAYQILEVQLLFEIWIYSQISQNH